MLKKTILMKIWVIYLNKVSIAICHYLKMEKF